MSDSQWSQLWLELSRWVPCGGLKGDLQTASQRQNPEAMAIIGHSSFISRVYWISCNRLFFAQGF